MAAVSSHSLADRRKKLSAPRTPGIYIVMMSLITTGTLAWSSIAASCIEVGFFWASVASALAVSIFAWRRNEQIAQAGMLLVYVMLACSITLAVASIVDISNFTLLGDKRDAETGMLLGGLIAFGTVAWIAVRCSKRFPVSLAWGALLALVMACSYNKTLPQEYALIVVVAALWAGMAAFIMLCRCKEHLSDNQYLAVLFLISIFIAFNCPKSMSNYTAGLLVSTMLFLAGLLLFIERRPASTSSRIAGLMFLYLGFSSVVQDVLQRGLGFNEIVADFPAFLFCMVVVAWVRFQKTEIPRGQYWVSLFSFAFFGICCLVPESHSDSIPGPMFGTMALFVVAAVGYAYSATITAALSWRDQFRYAFVACDFLIAFVITITWFSLSTYMLANNFGVTSIVALFKDTPLWPGDKVFINIAMREESLWPDSVSRYPPEKKTLKGNLKAIRPPEDKFSGISDSEQHRLESLGYDNAGIRWAEVKNSLTLLKVNSGSPASEVGLSRGDRIIAVNGLLVKDYTKDYTIDNLLRTWDVGKKVSLDVLTSSGISKKVSMSTGVTRQEPPMSRVVITPKGGKVGYLYLDSFDDFLSRQIKTHFTTFKREGVRDLVLDMRYNPGGLTENAALLANLIAGSKLAGKRFVTFQHSQRQIDRDYDYVFECLPESLSTRRLVVLTTDDTCSASEVVINGLKPYMPVYTVGSTTCGKPYQMTGFRFGDKIVFPVTARVLNSRGDGHYISGIRPDYKAEDDLTHQLGDPEEGVLKKALEVLDREVL